MSALLFRASVHSPTEHGTIYLALLNSSGVANAEIEILEWLLSAERIADQTIQGTFIGPRSEMVSPWSSNAVDIAKNIGLSSVVRIEQFHPTGGATPSYDPMLEQVYNNLTLESLNNDRAPEGVVPVEDIRSFDQQYALALSEPELEFLEQQAALLGRPFTDTELFAFGQINSEHCRHKIFNGTFSINGEEQPESLFSMIKSTSKRSPKNLVSAYRDNVAFVTGPQISLFAPENGAEPSSFTFRPMNTVLSLKAETHNFPTTVEPFYGASTGAGGEIRDRMAGGRGSFPLAGTALYMTGYSRMSGHPWEENVPERTWRYQSPEQILMKASNGASDFGNKFGQPLITGSLATFEGKLGDQLYAYDRAVMLAGGVGFADRNAAEKATPEAGDLVVVLGGDNYRIGMAGGSVSSVSGGEASTAAELSAVQRANPEMQKRVYNVIRSLAEQGVNPIRAIHDHGAGGHLNCLTELLEEVGGELDLEAFPVGDKTLSAREILCNESQERMGLLIAPSDLETLKRIAERERAPVYVVGRVTGDHRITVKTSNGPAPVSLPLSVLLGTSPKTTLSDRRVERQNSASLSDGIGSAEEFKTALHHVLQLEGVACKDWLTNKVDRCVSGRVAQQQCVGPLQLPLANFGAMALDLESRVGVATALGHASVVGLLDAEAGSRLSIAEALTNIVFGEIRGGIQGLSLSANWMWPAKRDGENDRLYRAVKACSEFACALGIPIPTGKDSLSMSMRYPDGQEVRSPGTVVITAIGELVDVQLKLTPDLKSTGGSLIYIDFSGMESFPLGGSAYHQSCSLLGGETPDVCDTALFMRAFSAVQELIATGVVLAGHDVSSGGIVSALAEMAFTGDIGARLVIPKGRTLQSLFCEKPAVILQLKDGSWGEVAQFLSDRNVRFESLGEVTADDQFSVVGDRFAYSEKLSELREVWFRTSALFDARQTPLAEERRNTLDQRKFALRFPESFSGRAEEYNLGRTDRSGLQAAVIREQGTNGEREMALALHAAGFDVRDVTMSDLVSGRETLQDVRLVAFPGGFANSDTLGAAKGWAGVFRYNERALSAIRDFYARPDTLSLAVCNGCQLVMELGLLSSDPIPPMRSNRSQKFESSFLEVEIGETNSVFLSPLQGSRLGIWVAHGEGQFTLPGGEDRYSIPLRYVSDSYPMNPNGSPHRAAALSSKDGRHLAMMPHLERSLFSWNWGYYPEDRSEQFSPWIVPFVSAREWLLRVTVHGLKCI